MQIRIPFSSYTCELDQVQSLIEILRVECLDIYIIEVEAGDQSMETEGYDAHDDSGGTSSFYASFSESKNPSMKVNHVSDSINSNHNQNQSDHSYNFETDKKSQPKTKHSRSAIASFPDATCEFCDKLFSVNT